MTHANEFLFTSESVTEGHPDKMADQISDAVLDAILHEDPNARVACETFLNTGLVVVAGEVSTSAYVDVQSIVRDTIDEIGYNHSDYGFDARTCGVLVSLDEQSADIAQGVDTELDARPKDEDPFEAQGAGDQGMMFGYATTETDELMPLPITLAHGITRQLSAVRKDQKLPYLRPDGKAQVTVRYVDNQPVQVTTVVVSSQHAAEWDGETLTNKGRLRNDIIEHVIKPVLGDYYHEDIVFHINPTGKFIMGGPQADAGLTGRKIIVDTYGGSARHGGGAFSGKDSTKVDRSAAYAARWVAKNVVAAGLAQRCEVQVAYAIGKAHPVSLLVDTFGTGTVDDAAITRAVAKTFDLRPGAIIDALNLRRPIYRQTAAYGHFGRPDLNLPWEETNRVEQLKSHVDAGNGVAVAGISS